MCLADTAAVTCDDVASDDVASDHAHAAHFIKPHRTATAQDHASSTSTHHLCDVLRSFILQLWYSHHLKFTMQCHSVAAAALVSVDGLPARAADVGKANCCYHACNSRQLSLCRAAGLLGMYRWYMTVATPQLPATHCHQVTMSLI